MNELEVVAAPAPATQPQLGTGREALVWDSTNTSAVIMARGLRRLGYRVHWVGSAVSPWRSSKLFDGRQTIIRDLHDEQLLRLFQDESFDVVMLHGDDHVRWCLDHWQELPDRVRSQLPGREALQTALSKQASMQLAERLGVPVLPTERCTSPGAVAEASHRLAPDCEVVLKGEGGAAGTAVASLRAGVEPDRATWERVTRFAPVALVQRRISGPRVFMSVVYEHGVERAACLHEKIASFPVDFGPTAYAVTRHVDEVHDYAERMFSALRWHGIANIEFRQDERDKRWHFMEINPRVAASMGIQDVAGMDIAATWAAVCAGHGGDQPPGRAYRDGVRFAWGVRGLALAMRRPWSVPAWAGGCFLGSHTDLAALDPSLRRRAVRLAFWMARHV